LCCLGSVEMIYALKNQQVPELLVVYGLLEHSCLRREVHAVVLVQYE